MAQSMTGLKRTHYCNEVDESMIGKTVTVMGWVNKRRDLGQLVFIALRDRTGIVQATVNENTAEPNLFEIAQSVRGEYVLAITGKVSPRNEKDINTNMKTGKIEILVDELRILSEAEVPPFQVSDTGVNNDLRLKYRYLDLRKPTLFNNMLVRHKTAQIVRRFFDEEGFIEIETPILTKSTPEGARDYLVPSRVNNGKFYALPQSPQIFKQLLMLSGVDKYFQIVRCFRDEDLRAERQPEFTQIDVECSFVEMDDILNLSEKLMKKVFKEILDMEIQTPFLRMPYKEAMERFGSDKPDIRFGIELKDISKIVENSGFQVFETALNEKGSVRCINAEGCANFSRRQIDALVEVAKTYKAKGLAWITISETGEIKTSLSKFLTEEKINEIIKCCNGKNGDLILICADKNDVVFDVLGALRIEIAKKLDLLKKDEYKFLWVTEFPLLEWSEEDNRYYAKHHPFTAPVEEDIQFLETEPNRVRATAYDMVLNGSEIFGGSIRISRKELQEKMFKALGFTEEEANERFGFLMDAYKYGAPPHGGIACGFDRLIMHLVGTDSIRDVIAFPKVKDGSCPMTDAPNIVEEIQLNELGIGILKS